MSMTRDHDGEVPVAAQSQHASADFLFIAICAAAGLAFALLAAIVAPELAAPMVDARWT